MRFITLMLPFILAACVPSLNKGKLKFVEAQRGTPFIYPELITADAQEVKFEALKKTILTPYCIKCHEDVSDEQGLMGWVKKGDVEGSKLFSEIKNGHMPKKKPPMPTAYLEFVRRYIEGLKDTPVVVVPVNYEKIKEKIFTPYCITCHARLETTIPKKWIVPGKPEESKLFTEIMKGTMPKLKDDGSNAEFAHPLSDEQKEMVRSYIEGLH